MVGTGKLNVFTGEIDLIFSPTIDNRPMDLGWVRESDGVRWNERRERYSPDGKLVFYRSGDNLVLADRQSGHLMWESVSEERIFQEEAIWQPNSEGLAYLQDRILENVDPETDYYLISDLFYLTADGTQTFLISSFIEDTLIWSPDSKHLGFVDYTTDCLNIIDISTGLVSEPIKFKIKGIYTDNLWVSETQLAVRLNGEIWIIDVNSKVYMPITTIGFRIVGVL
jgi:hypothetical protein